MGYEARCHARAVDSAGIVREGTGAVALESDEIIVRGDARVRVPRASIRSVAAVDGRLTIVHDAGALDIALGPDAEKWRARLLAPPKSRLDKLDVKPGARVWLRDVVDPTFADELRARTPHVMSAASPDGYDIAFVQVERADDLTRIAEAAATLPPTAALWIVHPKGPSGVPDTAIFGAARAAGLTYTKVAKFSDTHTAEKLVWPRSAK